MLLTEKEYSEKSFLTRFGPWAVITGASSGIGEEFAYQLGDMKFNLVLTARNEEKLREISNKITKRNKDVKVRVISADLSVESGWEKVKKGTEDLDVGLLVNNAGIANMGAFMYYPLHQHMKLVGLNVCAVTALAYTFIERFIQQKKNGGIIFVSSVSKNPVPWMSSYSASKAFMGNLAIVLRHELKQYNINVLSLEPRAVNTNMTKGLWAQLGWTLVQPETVVEKAIVALHKNKMRVVVSAADPDDDQYVENVEAQLDKVSGMAKKAWHPSRFRYRQISN